MRLALALILVSVQSKAARDTVRPRIERTNKACGELGIADLIAGCIFSSEEKYGVELERLYKRLLRETTSNVAVLRSSQRAWLQYQKRICNSHELTAADEGPRAASLASARCLLQITLQRIEKLRAMLA